MCKTAPILPHSNAHVEQIILKANEEIKLKAELLDANLTNLD